MWLHLFSTAAQAGLGPADVLVLYNADDPRAPEVADAYAAARSLPVGHLCPVRVDPLATQVDWATFDSTIRAPFEACLAALPDPDEIDAVVTVRGLPYVVSLPTYVVGLEAALQVGRGTMPDGAEIGGTGQITPSGFAQANVQNPTFVGGYCDPADVTVTNPYSGWYVTTCGLHGLAELPGGFVRPRPHEVSGFDLSRELFIVTRLDGFDADDALDLVDRAVAADGTFPSAEVLCMAGADEARAARDPECQLTVSRLASAGVPATWMAHDPALSGRTVSAYFTGADNLREAIDGQTYVPGAVVDNLTSYGAVPGNFFCDETGTVCPASEGQTSIARFVRAGATAVHGTVAEPLNNVFPNAGALVLYTDGYTLGESFLYAQQFLYWQNLLLGDPLVAPWAERPTVTLPGATAEGTPVHVVASHPDGVKTVRLYLAGALVAEEDGDTLDWDAGASEGDALDLLAVAVADVRTAERPEWPVPSQTVRADTQGWTAAVLTVGPPNAPPGTTTGPGDTDDPGALPGEADNTGCGCDAGVGGVGWLGLALVGGLGRSRRRRGVATRPAR